MRACATFRQKVVEVVGTDGDLVACALHFVQIHSDGT